MGMLLQIVNYLILLRCERNFVKFYTMKSVCVAFLVICALQFVHSDDLVATRQYDRITNYLLPQQRESFIEIIENIAKQTIQLAKDAIKVLQSRIEQLFQDIYEKVFGIQQMGDDALNTILSDIEKLSGNNQKGVTSCIQDKMGEMKQIVLNGREDISKCIQIATGEAANIRESLVPYVESISTLITNITGVIGKCSTSSNPVSSAICITQHVTEISNAISNIIRDSQEAIRLATVQINALVINTRGCVKTTADTVKVAVEKIISDCRASTE